MRVHLRERVGIFGDSEQAIQVGQRVFERADPEIRDSARDFLAMGPLVIVRCDLEIAVQEVDLPGNRTKPCRGRTE